MEKTEVVPLEIDDVLVNPGMGFTTFHSFNGDERNSNYPECSIAYFRWYWDELEPEDGKIDLGMIDSVLALARAHGQKLAFRVMCQNGHMRVPQWLRDAGVKGQPYPDGANWQPQYDDPLFLEKHQRLIVTLARRYDGHPDIDHIDIGSVGRWGEWHTTGTGMEMPANEVRRKIIDFYLDNFHSTPLVMLIGGEYGLAYAVRNGCGWRADCLGDMGGFSKTWNHMENYYQQALDEAQANESWKQAPVVFESCWTMQHWKDMGWDLDYILSEALKWHISVLNNKSSPIPEEWQLKVTEFQKKMGYRFVLKRLAHQSRITAGGEMRLSTDWENKGVAPCYLNYPLAVEFRSAKDSTSWVVETEKDITAWLPGPVNLEITITVPQDIPPGEYELGLGMLDPHSGKPAIKLAVKGRGPDGWYRLSRVKVR
ncbi:MAG TPA: DUF4832 domain-containing protein [archaeon]|nr:DUF4832 domain-containing protein [archaeon]